MAWTAANFREEVQGWIAANFPASLRGRGPLPFHAKPDPNDRDYDRWRCAMGDTGWGVPTWPVQYGGAGLGPEEAQIIAAELAAAEAFNPIGHLGVTMLGPTLLEYGTPEQKAEHLPKIARAEVRWCQGFSEPGAGSDLASLRTSAQDCGDHWLVNGQKIWTSGANISEWCFCLVRTDTTTKQNGITFVLIDMTTPGIEARPISLINGVSHFCEVFLTDVVVPKANTVGPVNGGWSVAKRLLQHERTSLSSDRAAPEPLALLAAELLGRDMQRRIADPDLRQRLIAHAARSRAYSLTLARAATEAKSNAPGQPAVSVVKNLGAALAQQRFELLAELYGADALGESGEGFDPAGMKAGNNWLYSKCYSIYGGSHEIQNNITAKRVLGLPG